MPVYEIQHPTTGQTIRLEGDGVPSDSDIREAFASVAKTAPPKMLTGKDYQDARSKFIEDTAATGTKIKEKALDVARAASPYVRPILETGGAVLGGLTGGALGGAAGGIGAVPGGVAGAALGYAGGKNLADTGDKLLGTMPVQSGAQLAGTTAKDLLVGGSMEAGGQLVGKGLSAVSAPIANRAGDYVRRGVNAAKSLNIPITPAEEMGSKPLALGESVLGKMPVSSGMMQEAQQVQQSGLQAAKNRIANTLGATSETAENIGSTVKEGLANKSQAFATKAGVLYDRAKSFLPPGTQIPTDNLAERAATLHAQFSKMPESIQNKDLMKVLDDLSLNTGSLDYDGLQGLRSEFKSRIDANDAAAKAGQAGVKGMSNTEAGAYKFLKGGLEKDLQTYADTSGGDFKDAMDVANSFYREGKQIYNAPIIRRVMKSNPEAVVDMVMRPNSATDVKLLRQAVGDDAFQMAREAFTTKLLSDEQNGLFSVAKFANKLEKFDPSTLSAIYKPEEIEALKQLAATKPVVQGAEKMAGNPSGTAQNMLSYAQVGTAGGLVINGLMTGDPKKMAEGAAVMFAPAGIAKLYLSPLGRRYLTGAFKASGSAQQAANIATKLIGIAGIENLQHQGANNAP